MTGVSSAFFWGLAATSSLVLGGLLACWVKLGRRTLGIILASGAGVLFSAVAYEMVFEAVSMAKGSGFPAFGFLTGALVFFASDKLIAKLAGGGDHGTGGGAHQSNLVVPMVLAIILDGIPESMVIGLGVLESGAVSLAMLVAVFISNFPEAVASTTGMRSAGWSRGAILLLWISIAVACAIASAAGYALFGGVSHLWLSFIQAFAGGAILMMLANTMIPEAYEHAGKLAGIFTVLGFGLSVVVVLFEHAGAG